MNEPRVIKRQKVRFSHFKLNRFASQKLDKLCHRFVPFLNIFYILREKTIALGD